MTKPVCATLIPMNSAIYDLMPGNPAIAAAWKKYVADEETGVRADALKSLDTVVDALLAAEEEVREAWVRDFCQRRCDRRESLPLRQPLFERVILPALVSHYRRHEPGAARWLALLFYCGNRSTKACQTLLAETGAPLALLKRALEDDPCDDIARAELIQELARWFNFTLHELPAGVLYGMDGASIEECNQMLDEVNFFEGLLTAPEYLGKYTNLIACCRYHYAAYAHFPAFREQWQSYADYLKRSDATPPSR